MKKPYDITRDYTIQEGCPWYEAQQAFGPPNLNLCERSSCTYFDEPVNTVSNLAVIIVGLILIKKLKRPLLKQYGLIAVIMGIASFVYHATNNLLTQYIDFLGMFLFASFLLGFQALRLQGRNPKEMRPTFLFLFILHSVALFFVHKFDVPIQYILLGGSIPILLTDLAAGFKERSFALYKYSFFGFVVFGIAQAFAIADAQKFYCNPENLILHGHVLWHVLVSIGIFIYGFHIKTILDSLEKSSV